MAIADNESNFLYDIERQRGVLVDFGLAEVLSHAGNSRHELTLLSERVRSPPIAYARITHRLERPKFNQVAHSRKKRQTATRKMTRDHREGLIGQVHEASGHQRSY